MLQSTPQITAFTLFDLSVRFNPLTRNSIMKEKRKYKALFRNNKTCDTWYTSWYLPSFKLMVAVHRKVFDYCTYKAFNIIFPTFSVNADGGSKWLNEVLRSLDRGFLFHGYNRPLKLLFLTMVNICFNSNV